MAPKRDPKRRQNRSKIDQKFIKNSDPILSPIFDQFWSQKSSNFDQNLILFWSCFLFESKNVFFKKCLCEILKFVKVVYFLYQNHGMWPQLRRGHMIWYKIWYHDNISCHDIMRGKLIRTILIRTRLIRTGLIGTRSFNSQELRRRARGERCRSEAKNIDEKCKNERKKSS